MRLLFSAAYSAIEPLGLMHLAGLARDMGWETKISLIKDHNDVRLMDDIEEFVPDLIGFNIYTGNHIQTFDTIKKIRRTWSRPKIIVGGPHPTYFPAQAALHADYVVMSEGFHSLKLILSGMSKPGIMTFHTPMRFPMPDREILYKDYPEFAASPIKSIISMTGCPFQCSYCYNSSSIEDIEVPPELAQEIGETLGMSGRLFPFNIRTVADVVAEGREIVNRWGADIVYFQDDVHGFDIKDWLPNFVDEWGRGLGLPYHAQMRWEMVNGDGGKRRLDIIKDAGCTGLTLAVEAANQHIRKEVLDRATPDRLMFDGMVNLRERGFVVRTEQITGLPCGATTNPTPINIEADLGIVELNIKLKPDMAWASTFVPYAGTKLGKYSQHHGYYTHADNFDVHDTFFDKSVLRFPKYWVGPKLCSEMDVWLEGDDLELYRLQNQALRKHFNLLCLIPQGHILARQWIEGGDLSSANLNDRIKYHIYDEILYKPVV